MAILFYETTPLVEADLHTLLHDLVDRDQILCNRGNVQDILNVVVVALAERDIADMPNGVCGVVSRLHVARLIGRTQVIELLYVGRHVI